MTFGGFGLWLLQSALASLWVLARHKLMRNYEHLHNAYRRELAEPPSDRPMNGAYTVQDLESILQALNPQPAVYRPNGVVEYAGRGTLTPDQQVLLDQVLLGEEDDTSEGALEGWLIRLDCGSRTVSGQPPAPGDLWDHKGCEAAPCRAVDYVKIQ